MAGVSRRQRAVAHDACQEALRLADSLDLERDSLHGRLDPLEPGNDARFGRSIAPTELGHALSMPEGHVHHPGSAWEDDDESDDEQLWRHDAVSFWGRLEARGLAPIRNGRGRCFALSSFKLTAFQL
jgi:hypothetical protein